MEELSEAITVAVITGIISLIGTVITIMATSKKSEENMKIAQAVTDTKIEQLTSEVRSHNDFARRVPVLEEKISVANHRIDDLEAKVN